MALQALLIGCGNMGGALLSQWIKSDDIAFTIADPNASVSYPNVTLVEGPDALSQHSYDLLIVAIKPQLIESALPAYASLLKPDGVVASIAAGTTVQTLSNMFGGAPIVRIMPNMASAIGKGVSGLYATRNASALQRDLIEKLMRLAGDAIWVESEDQLDRLTAVSGSGPGFVFEIARLMTEAAQSLGWSETEAKRLVLGTMTGAIDMALEKDLPLGDLRNSVTSKNGATQAGLAAMNRDGILEQLLRETLQAAYKRTVELR